MHGAFKDPKLKTKLLRFLSSKIRLIERYNPLIFDPYPISDLIKNLIPYFRPAL